MADFYLSFAPLRRFPRFLEAVLATFLSARIAGQEARFLELLSEVRIKEFQGASNAMLDSRRLAGNSTAIDKDCRLEAIQGF